MDSLEHLFSMLGLEYQPDVLQVHRFRILRLFAEEVARIEENGPPQDELAPDQPYAEALDRAYRACLQGTAVAGPTAARTRGLVQLDTTRGRSRPSRLGSSRKPDG